MKRLLLLAAVALALPAAALAKGPSEAVVTGPGLDRPLTLAGSGSLPRLAERSGLYATTGFLRSRPVSELGPRYEATYTFPYPNRADETIRQDVYPYAALGPVTYTPPGQMLWGGRFQGGWYASGPELRALLVANGLPAQPPAAGTPIRPWVVAGPLALLAALGWAAWFARARWISAIRTPSVS